MTVGGFAPAIALQPLSCATPSITGSSAKSGLPYANELKVGEHWAHVVKAHGRRPVRSESRADCIPGRTHVVALAATVSDRAEPKP